MKVLNLYHSTTGNTLKVAERICRTLDELGHEVSLVAAGKEKVDLGCRANRCRNCSRNCGPRMPSRG